MEKLIKNALGQWALIREELRKAPEDVPPAAPPGPAAPTPEPEPTAPQRKIVPPADKNAHLTSLFNELKKHHQAGDMAKVGAARARIKDHVLSAPKGSIDFGALGDLRSNMHKGMFHYQPPAHMGYTGQGFHRVMRAISHDDMAEFANHHLGDAKSIKEIHDKHGGMKAVEALMRTMGANGDPQDYSPLKFKKPGMHQDLLDLVNPGKSTYDRDGKRHLGILNKPYMAGTKPDPALHKKVEDTWDDIMQEDNGDIGQGWDNPSKSKAHEDAVIARGLDMFKRHHKL